jgi:hypothetical protein
MCTCITHTCTRVRVSHFTRYYRVFNEQFIFVLRFYWLILPHLDCHINHDWLHIEVLGGSSWNLGSVTPGFKAKPDAHRMYAQDQVVIHTVRM